MFVLVKNASQNYIVFSVILTLSKLRKSIDMNIMYYTNETFSGVSEDSQVAMLMNP